MSGSLPGSRPDTARDEFPVLDSSRQELERLIASLPTVLIGLTPELRINRWNRMAERVFGLSAGDVGGKRLDDSSIRWDQDRIRRSIERCRSHQAPVRIDDLSFARPGGREGVLGLTITPVREPGETLLGFTIIGGDITERKILERQLAQAQKLRSIGQLASGIAHEINTPIQYVGDNTRFLKDAFSEILDALAGMRHFLDGARGGGPDSGLAAQLASCLARADLDYLIEEIPLAIQHSLEGVERITKIVRAMKEFAHPGREEKTPVDLNAIIETTITVARNEWKYVADMATDFDRSLPPVPCHPGEINQVVLNMIINAAHAVEDRIKQGQAEKGAIAISTRRRDEWVEIRIRDTGVGIPEPIRASIFDPFFTTKEIGRGTGQGLAICHPVIVEKHGGKVFFETAVGEGTTFTIVLPLEAQAG
jgi:PAS domain S-box-containing protein